ncbi:MAG: ribonuclease T [Pseudomonadota bacterium]
MKVLVSIALTLGVIGTAGWAEVSAGGLLLAEKSCEAFESKNKRTNPGQVRIQIGSSYEVLALNKPGGEWYQIRVPTQSGVEKRWVLSSCGGYVRSLENNVVSTSSENATDLLIALQWQPTFCERVPSARECGLVNSGRFQRASQQLSLHGLWPQPNGTFYCGVSSEIVARDQNGDWRDLPALQLDKETQQHLAESMPGVFSGLHRHEWYKHGTCYFADGAADEYFDDSLFVTDAINDAVSDVFVQSLGSYVSASIIRFAFDVAFGDGAGDRVQIKCYQDGDRILIQELRVALRGQITPTTDIGALILAGTPRAVGCDGGLIDPSGLQ